MLRDALQLDLAPFDGAVDLLVGKVALVHALHPVALLLEKQSVLAAAGEIFDGEVPMTVDIRGGGHCDRFWGARLAENAVNALGDHFGLAGLHLARGHVNARLALGAAAADGDPWFIAGKVFGHLLAGNMQGQRIPADLQCRRDIRRPRRLDDLCR